MCNLSVNCKKVLTNYLTFLCITFASQVHAFSNDVDDLLGADVKKQASNQTFAWPNKNAFLEAVLQGEMATYASVKGHDFNKKAMVYNSIVNILATDYNTPVLLNQSDICSGVFQNHVNVLLKLITNIKLSKISDEPPTFTVTDKNLRNDEQDRNHIKSMLEGTNKACKNAPFVNSFTLLLKEYSSQTELYVENVRANKIKNYNLSIEKKLEAEKNQILADSELEVIKAEANEKAERDKQYLQAIEKKETDRLASCHANPSYSRFSYANEVLENNQRIAEAKEAIKKEKEIGKVSGYEDAGKLNQLGRALVFAQERANLAYKNYRKNGGTISMSNLKPEPNPCL